MIKASVLRIRILHPDCKYDADRQSGSGQFEISQSGSRYFNNHNQDLDPDILKNRIRIQRPKNPMQNPERHHCYLTKVWTKVWTLFFCPLPSFVLIEIRNIYPCILTLAFNSFSSASRLHRTVSDSKTESRALNKTWFQQQDNLQYYDSLYFKPWYNKNLRNLNRQNWLKILFSHT